MSKIPFYLLIFSALLIGCETKTGTGALAGGALGVGAGALIGGGQGALIGGAVGAIGGGLVGAALDEQDRKNMEEKSPQTLRKIDNGEQLTVNDVKRMSEAGLSDEVIINQIQRTGSIFRLSTDEIISLKKADVSQNVIDYMIKTQ